MKRTIVFSLALCLAVASAPAAFAWRGGGAAVRGPAGNVAVRGPTTVYGGAYRAYPAAGAVAAGAVVGAATATAARPYYYAPVCGYYPNPPCPY